MSSRRQRRLTIRMASLRERQVVALALGEEKTRSELLPFLRKLRDPPVRFRQP